MRISYSVTCRRLFCSEVPSANRDVGGLSPKFFTYMCTKSAPFAHRVLKPIITTMSCGKITYVMALFVEFCDFVARRLQVKYEPYMSGSPDPECIHGGVIAAAIDHAGGMCAITALPHMGKIVSTVNFRVDYVNPLPVAENGMVLEGTVIDYDHILQLIRTDVICWNTDKTIKIAVGESPN